MADLENASSFGSLIFLFVCSPPMNRSARHLLLLIVAAGAVAAGATAFIRFRGPKRQAPAQSDSSARASESPVDTDLWNRSLEKVKEDRGSFGNVALEIPPELRHYSDRHWFMATQVAEVKKLNVSRCQDFVDLAAMIKRGELVPMPAVAENYILLGVGARVDGGVFTRYVANQNIELNDEAGLRAAYLQLQSTRVKLQKDILGLQTQLASLKKSVSLAKQNDLQDEIIARQRELKSNDADKAQMEQYYGQSTGLTESHPTLLRDYDSLQELAKNFGGRSFDLNDSSDRRELKVYLLSALKPQALKILEEIAKEYHDKFDRPLLVSSLVRPEQYQHALRKVNRYAVLIDTPPHSTGLAFDIDYRYMSGGEQNFLMMKLARMKDEGRIEVIRERGANYHVFAFVDGTRPSDELISASLEEAGGLGQETNHTEKAGANSVPRSRSAKKRR
jgi:hypothetical protein